MTPQTDWSDTEDATMALVVQAEACQITDNASFEAAVHLRSGVKALIAEIQAEYKPQKQAMDAAKRVILDKEKARLAPLEHIVSKVLNPRLDEYEAAKREEKLKAEIAAAREAKETGAIVPARAVEVPHVDGLSFVTRWKGEVTDFAALVRAVAAGQVTLDALMANQHVLDDLARQSKGQLAIPGVRCVSERSVRGT